jgi:hypothetical protein
MRSRTRVHTTMHRRTPQFLEGLTYFKSIVETLVVFGVCILVCHLWQLVIYGSLLMTL